MQRYTDLSQIQGPYDDVYLSPHLDDAVLSSGGAILRRTGAGGRVLVVTLCTAVPTRAQLGPLAEEFHGDWNLSADEAVTARLREDELAMGRVGADYMWAGFLDSIYRVPFGYDTRERLFGTPRPDDPLYDDLRRFLPALAARLPGATFYAPLGVGYHVDHQILHAVARELPGLPLAFYEDVYYALLPGELERRLPDLGARAVPAAVDISATLARKIAAIDSYASQVPELFGGSEKMAADITAYGARLAPEGASAGERTWTLAPADAAS